MQLLPALADGGHQAGGFEDGEVLAHRLAGHAEPVAELAQVLALAGLQPVEQLAPTGVGQGAEHVVHRSSVVAQWSQLLMTISSG